MELETLFTVPKRHVANLKLYEYSSTGYTPLDRALTPFWEWLVALIPLSIAPNVVTLVALVCSLGSSALVLASNFSLASPMPTWVYVLAALLVFCYAHLDAVDGKHARRIGLSSPLGQLFDHGCDALATPFLLLGVIGALAVGSEGTTPVLLLFCGMAPFFTATIEEYHVGRMRYSDGVIGITESLFLIEALILIGAVSPVGFWTTTRFGVCTLAQLLAAGVGVALLSALSGNIRAIWAGPLVAADKRGEKTVGLAALCIQLGALCCLFAAAMYWARAPSHVHGTLRLGLVSLTFALLATKSILAHMCREPLGLALLAIVAPLCALALLAPASVLAFYLVAVLYVAWYAVYVRNAMRAICAELDIPLLGIPERVRAAQRK